MSNFLFDKKQSLKRLEIPLNKFNEVAIPHHVDLLRKHKNNIQRLQKENNWEQIHHEQINATRVVKQLKGLLYEIDILRNQVFEGDLKKFDSLTFEAQQNVLSAIKEYLDINLKEPNKNETSEESDKNLINLQLQVEIEQESLGRKEECLKSFEELQQEILEAKELYEEFANLVKVQQESIDALEENAEMSYNNINEGTQTLNKIEQYKTTMYPVAGALLGTCIGGPIGLLAGIKLGGLAAFGFGLLGFTGGRFLKKKREEELITKVDNFKESSSLIDISKASQRKKSN